MRVGGGQLHGAPIGALEPAGPADPEQGAGAFQLVRIGTVSGEPR